MKRRVPTKSFALLAVALLATGCSSNGDDASNAATETSSDGKTTTSAEEGEDVNVDGSQMATWIDEIVDFGIRRPGYEADDKTARWIADHFRRAGLENVRLDPVEVNRWTPERCQLTWWSDAAPDRETVVECFALPYSNPDVDLTASIILDDGSNDLTGRVGVVRDMFTSVPQTALADAALEVVAPDEFVQGDTQPIPFGFRNGDLFSDFFGPTTARGGIGMVGVLEGLGTDQYYAPYTGHDEELPAVWVGEEAGTALLGAIGTGPVTAHIEVAAERRTVTSMNVLGELPADSDAWVVVGTHHDAPWASAVEDATGIVSVLGQAYHWASVPQAERPHRLLFVASTGHMAGAAGTTAVAAQYPELLDKTVLAVYLEHVARRAEMTPNGLEVRDTPETRWWFTTDRPDLRTLVGDALRAEGLDRDLILPAVGFFGSAAPLSDVAPLSLAGVPVVSLISTPIYLFDPRDTPDKVDVDGLVDVRAATIRMIEATADLTTTRSSP